MRSGRGAPVGGTSGAPASPSEGSGESSGKLSTGRRFPAIEQWLGFPSGAHRRFIAGSIFRGSGGVAEAEKSITWSPDARAAILRDESGAIVGTTWGGAQCWFPRRSKRGDRFALIDGAGAETIARCRWCPGCLRYDSQQLRAAPGRALQRLLRRNLDHPGQGCLSKSRRRGRLSLSQPQGFGRARVLPPGHGPSGVHCARKKTASAQDERPGGFDSRLQGQAVARPARLGDRHCRPSRQSRGVRRLAQSILPSRAQATAGGSKVGVLRKFRSGLERRRLAKLRRASLCRRHVYSLPQGDCTPASEE